MTSSQKALKEAMFNLGLIGLALMVSLLSPRRPPLALAGGPADEGASIYKAKCAMCHGPDGSGNTPMGKKMKLRDLRSPEVQKQSDAQITEIIARGKTPMQAYEKQLGKDKIRELVVYLRELGKKR